MKHWSPAWIGRIIKQLGVFHNEISDINTEAIDSPFEPVAQDIKHGGLNGWIAPVEIRLLLEKRVKIVLICCSIPFPG